MNDSVKLTTFNMDNYVKNHLMCCELFQSFLTVVQFQSKVQCGFASERAESSLKY